MKKPLYIIIGIALVACQDATVLEDSVVEPEQQLHEVGIDIVLTRAPGDNEPRTYRALLYNSSREYTGRQGTYYDDPNETRYDWLSPWETTELGVKVGNKRNVASGLYYNHYDNYITNCQLLLVTPAVAITKKEIKEPDPTPSNPSNEKVVRTYYVFPYDRAPKGDNAALDGLSFSKLVTLGSLTSSGGESYKGPNDSKATVRRVIHFEEHGHNPLRQRRSKVRFKVQCGDDISLAKFSKMTISNVVDKAWYNPSLVNGEAATGTTEYGDFEDITLGTITVYDGPSVNLHKKPDTSAGETRELYIPYVDDEHPEYTDCADVSDANGTFFYMLSQNLAAKNEDTGEYTHTQPTVKIKMFDNIEHEFLLPACNLEPHKYYTYTLTINSVYITVTITAKPWDDGGTLAGDIDETPTAEVTIGTFTVNPWEGTTVPVEDTIDEETTE